MSGTSLELPTRKRSYVFALTPLADAMFQLLIFFMLSTSLTPYSLMTLRSAQDAPDAAAAEAAGEGTGEDPNAPPPVPTGITIWTLRDGLIVTGGTEFDIAQVKDLAAAFGDSAVADEVILVIDRSARMQDLASTMEALQTADVAGVRVVQEGAE